MMRWGRLALWCGAVAFVWVGLQFHQATGSDDINLLTAIGALYFVGALVMLVATRRWTARGLGLLGTMLADSFLYLSSAFASRFGWMWLLSEGRLDLVRALFLVGGTLLAYGLVAWAVQRWRGRNGQEVSVE